jgi:hypothetical protein
MRTKIRIGIEDAKCLPMTTMISPARSECSSSQTKAAQLNERPLRICVVFDEHASALLAEVLITQVASDYERETQAFSFDELDGAKPGVAAARRAADADILVLAARGDRMLPAHIRMWLGLGIGMRDEGKEGALVALITKVAGTADLHSSILDYLETIAIIGGLAFFPQHQGISMPLHVTVKNH